MTYKLEVKPLPMPEGVSDEDLPIGIYITGASGSGPGTNLMSGETFDCTWDEILRIDDGDILPSDIDPSKSRFRKDGKRVWYAQNIVPVGAPVSALS